MKDIISLSKLLSQLRSRGCNERPLWTTTVTIQLERPFSFRRYYFIAFFRFCRESLEILPSRVTYTRSAPLYLLPIPQILTPSPSRVSAEPTTAPPTNLTAPHTKIWGHATTPIRVSRAIRGQHAQLEHDSGAQDDGVASRIRVCDGPAAVAHHPGRLRDAPAEDCAGPRQQAEA